MNSVPSGPTAAAVHAERTAAANRLMFFHFAAAVSWTILILVLCWLPRNLVQEIERESPWFRIPDLDKAIHAGLFVVLAILWVRLAASRQRVWAVVLGGFALGAVSELGQLVPIVNRNAELYDFVTDCGSVLIGVAIAPLVKRLLRPIESRLFSTPLEPESLMQHQ